MYNVKNFICRFSSTIFSDVDAIHSWNVCCIPKSSKNNKTPLLVFKVIQGHCFRCQLKVHVRLPILVINSNLGAISHRFWDTATYWLKSPIFPYSLWFSALAWEDPFWIYGKALKLESSMQPTVKSWWSQIAPVLTDPPMWQTDGQTDRIAMTYTVRDL